MDLQFHGANCVSITHKGKRLVIDDNLAELGSKTVVRPDDAALYTGKHESEVKARIVFDGPGEYEVGDISVIGVAARAHTDEEGRNATIFKCMAGDLNVVVTGHIYPELDDAQQEAIGTVDVLFVPVGGNGYTVDAVGALKLIKELEPKLVVPTHYADKTLKYPVPQQELSVALKELAMEPKETISKLRLKATDLSDVTQLLVLEKS